MASTSGVQSPRVHLVARCLFCGTAVWPSRLAGLVPGVDVGRASRMRLDELAFVATATPGKRGWKPTRTVTNAAELDAVGGSDALDQLRRLVMLALKRWFYLGVLRREDIAELLEIRSQPVERHAEPVYAANTYLPVGRAYSAEEFVP